MSDLSAKKLAVMAFFVVCLSVAGLAIGGDDPPVWRPITPEEMQMKTPKVEPDADAEAIFWEVRLDDKKRSKMSYSHYVRVKIFTERGRERFSKMDIPFMKGKKVEGVAARVIKPDGTIIELKPEDIFEREIAKAGKARILAKSFAVPGIEPGVIVEYQYSETIKGDSAAGERLIFQRDIPLQKVSYYVRPYADSTLAFNSYNMPETRFTEDQKGFSVGTMHNVPAFKEEPFMPPADEVRKWVYLSYRSLGSLFQWGYVSRDWNYALQRLSKPNKEVKAKAAELTAGVSTDDEKLRQIYEFVQRDIKNISFDRTLTEEQIEKIDVKDGDDALKRGMGNAFHVDMLFASLARAAGFETNIVLAGDRSENFFSAEKYPFPSFIEMSGISVKVGQDWKFFDPCKPYLPYGAMTWNREDVRAMLIGDGGFIWKIIPSTDYSKTLAKRTGRFNLASDGTLEGTVTLQYGGHDAIARRQDEYRDSPAKREENIKEQIKSRISTAEISEVTISNFDDNTKPLSYTFKVRVPNYAQRAGKRMILQPGFFENGSSAVFSSATRLHDIYFPYPWSEEDDIEIRLPNGFAPDSADSPAPAGDTQNISGVKVTMQHLVATNVLRYKRNFHFGAGGGSTLFKAKSYQQMKSLFDSFHRADTHAISIKQTTP